MLAELQQSEQLEADSDAGDDDGSDDNSSRQPNTDSSAQNDVGYDRDYVPKSFVNNEYNYMDPNFMPE